MNVTASLSTAPTTITSLPTELLVHLLSFLPVIDLLSAKRTNRRIRNVVTDSSYLQYIMRIQLNGVDDLLPPDYPVAERLRLLRQHENSWNRLKYNTLTAFLENTTDRLYDLQDGYLIYTRRDTWASETIPYGYVDLHSASPNVEPHWVHIVLQQIRFPFFLKIEFAVDHNLVVTISQPSDRATVDVSFFEFTTGATHPLSLKPTVHLQSPVNPVPTVVAIVQAEILGDYILISVTYEYTGCYVSLISWKTGTTTVVRELFFRESTEWRRVPKLVAIDNDLIAIVEDNTNSIEICRLELTPPDVRMKSVCFLELPPLKHNSSVSVPHLIKEWVSTSIHDPASESVRSRPNPFRSSKVSNIRFDLHYHMCLNGLYSHKGRSYTMIVSVADLLSDIDTSRRSVPWTDWGPPRTRIYPTNAFSQRPVGTFWICRYSPLTIRDYDSLRARCRPSTTKASSLCTTVFTPSITEGEQWVGGEVETCLPFREFIIPNLRFNSDHRVIADREWLVDISSYYVRPVCITVYHVT